MSEPEEAAQGVRALLGHTREDDLLRIIRVDAEGTVYSRDEELRKQFHTFAAQVLNRLGEIERILLHVPEKQE